MKRKKESASGTVARTPLASHLEAFAKAVADGYSHVEAAVACGRAEGSASYLYRRPGVKQRIAELLAIKARSNEEELVESANGMKYPRVTVTRNHIINGLALEARTAKSACARVSAWQVLADIFLLRAKNIQEVMDFIGWTNEELQEFATLGTIPARIRNLEDSRKNPLFRVDPNTGRITDQVTDRGVHEKQYPRVG